MAIGRSVRAPKQVILRGDNAIDWERSDWDQYVESGFDAQHLAVLPGQTPTTFTIGQLTYPQSVALDGLRNESAGADLLIRCGLRSLHNYVVIKPDGREHVISGEPPLTPVGTLGNVISDKWMDELGLLPSQRDALAALIRKNSEASIPLSKPSGGGSGA